MNQIGEINNDVIIKAIKKNISYDSVGCIDLTNKTNKQVYDKILQIVLLEKVLHYKKIIIINIMLVYKIPISMTPIHN